jgi:hypothetical protein
MPSLRSRSSYPIVAVLAGLLPLAAEAQLAPTGGHYGGRPSDTGFTGPVNATGGFSASVPIDLPVARGGLPVPFEISYGARGVGAAGLGWEIPLSYLRRDTTSSTSRRANSGWPRTAPSSAGELRGSTGRSEFGTPT